LEESLARTFPDFWDSLFSLPPYHIVLYYLQAARIPLSSPPTPPSSPHLTDYYRNSTLFL
jgi:hypothetical protein